MKDPRYHYPKEPFLWDLLSGVWKTGTTICGKRRNIERITNNPDDVTCNECVDHALAYWSEQAASCKSLIEYAESGKLQGTSAECVSLTLVPKLRIALQEAIETAQTLSNRRKRCYSQSQLSATRLSR